MGSVSDFHACLPAASEKVTRSPSGKSVMGDGKSSNMTETSRGTAYLALATGEKSTSMMPKERNAQAAHHMFQDAF